MKDIAIVGASMAGLTAARTLRKEGFDGNLTLIGDEPYLPYRRPALSKQFLLGAWKRDRLDLAVDVELTQLPNTRVTGVDFAERRLHTPDNRSIHFDGLVIATGLRAKRPSQYAALPGVYTLRNLDDSIAIDAAMRRGASVVVIGGGFVGTEVAAAARLRGLPVTVLERAAHPLANVLGVAVAIPIEQTHRDQGVRIRAGALVESIIGSDRVTGVRLVDGEVIPADVVVISVGSTPATEWLAGSGLNANYGVECDESCAVIGVDDVVAAGDVARWHHPLAGTRIRLEHWDNAMAQGAAAAKRLLAGPEASSSFVPTPYFWSDQFDRKIQVLGLSGDRYSLALIEGSLFARSFVALYHDGGRVVGLVAVNASSRVNTYRPLLGTQLDPDVPDRLIVKEGV